MFNGKIHYKLPFSIAMFVYKRVYTVYRWAEQMGEISRDIFWAGYQPKI